MASQPGNAGAVAANEREQRPAEEIRAFSWSTFLDTYLPALVLALGTGIALPAIPTLARSFHVSFGLASGVLTAFLLGGLAGSIPTGWLIDRFGRRRIMLIGPLLTALMAFAVFASQNFPELLIFRFIDGWAAQMWLLGRVTGIAARAGAGQRGKLLSWMFGMDSVGRLSGPLAGGFIAAAWGIRAPFAAYSVLALLAVIPVYCFIQDVDDRGQAKQSETEVAQTAPTLRQLILPRLPFFAVAFFSAMARGPIFADVLHLYAAFAYNLGPKAIGLLATSASSVSLPIGFVAGWGMDRFGRKRTMVPGFSGVTVAMTLLALTAFVHASLTWYVAAFLFGVGSQSLTAGSTQTLGADVAPSGARGAFLGVWNFVNQSGVAISPIAFAFLSETTGYASAFLFLSCAALVVALLLIFLVPETGKPTAARAWSADHSD
jgi:MFS family permease